MTDRIIREIEESRALFGLWNSVVREINVDSQREPAASTTGIIASPGLQGVPVSCYTSSFAAWTFSNTIIPDLDESEDDNDDGDDDVEEVETLPRHFFIDRSPDRQPTEPAERTFAEVGIQTELSLSLSASDIRWTPTINETFNHHSARDDITEFSNLEQAIAAQQQDALPGGRLTVTTILTTMHRSPGMLVVKLSETCRTPS